MHASKCFGISIASKQWGTQGMSMNDIIGSNQQPIYDMTCMLNSPPNSLFGVSSHTITSPHPASDTASNIKPLLRGVSLHINFGGRGAKKRSQETGSTSLPRGSVKDRQVIKNAGSRLREGARSRSLRLALLITPVALLEINPLCTQVADLTYLVFSLRVAIHSSCTRYPLLSLSNSRKKWLQKS